MDEQRVKIIKVMTVSAVIFMVLLFSTLIVNLIMLAQKNSEYKSLQRQRDELITIMQSNQEAIEYKTTDRYIERYARDYQNLMGKNEEVFIGKEGD